MIRILAYGGGIQSEAIARMSLDGDLPRLDHIIFADTLNGTSGVRAWFRERGYEVQGFVKHGEVFASASLVDDPPNDCDFMLGGQFNRNPSCRSLGECFADLARRISEAEG